MHSTSMLWKGDMIDFDSAVLFFMLKHTLTTTVELHVKTPSFMAKSMTDHNPIQATQAQSPVHRETPAFYRRRFPILLSIGIGLGCMMEYMLIRMGYYQGIQKRQLESIQELREAKKRIMQQASQSTAQ